MTKNIPTKELEIINRRLHAKQPAPIVPPGLKTLWTRDEYLLRRYAPIISSIPALFNFFVHGMKEVVWQQTPGEELLVWWNKEHLDETQIDMARIMFHVLSEEDRMYILEHTDKHAIPFFMDMYNDA